MMVRNILFSMAAIGIYMCTYFALKYSNLSLYPQLNAAKEETTKTDNKKNAIQVALLLDTSGSMSGLIEQAKSQLWNILNELARTVKNGEETVLEIALYEYGNPSKTNDRNQINQLTPFTTDMDLVSEQLFSLATSGGDEFCGAVIQTAMDHLDWKSEDGLKIMYIAGNEYFSQGPVSYVTACQNALEKGIVINTIYCGDPQSGVKELWEAGAIAGGGDYLNINHNQETVYIKTPYDDQINQLNTELNNTYIPYGSKGLEKKENQMNQDKNASKYSVTNAADRAAFKSSLKYKNTDWDLVDAYKADTNILKKAKPTSEAFKNLTADELEVRILEIADQRQAIQTQIQELDQKRRLYKAEQTQMNKEESTLQKSMISTIQKQAEAKGYNIKN